MRIPKDKKMTYEATLDYLYTSIPVFQRVGASAYKPGLGTSIALDDYLGNPHRAYATIHVAGTNGKGSVSHLLAAILQQAGYKVGLYTSPHLVDFRERIRVNGEMISKAYVTDFITRHRPFFESLHPSFFELTSSLAFDYFRAEKVDFALIEVGLGGRLDSTNIIEPILSVITNISLDHTQFLGDTVEKIAAEKAGIMKKDVPAVIGEAEHPGVARVFTETAARTGALLTFAASLDLLGEAQLQANGRWHFETTAYGPLEGSLGGIAQQQNARTVLAALYVLEKERGLSPTAAAVREGFARVVELTGLTGRWQTLQQKPRVIADTGHNVGGWEYLARQLHAEAGRHAHLYMVTGMVNDKDIEGVLALMPREATYFFTQASIQRSLPAEAFAAQARAHGLQGTICPTVAEAVRRALRTAGEDDLIFIGGSTFVVADALPLFRPEE